MFSFRTTPFEQQGDLVLRSGRVGLLSNQTGWDPAKGEYLFETLYKKGNLKRVFMPEHGLFGELQDQVKLDKTSAYDALGMESCEFVSLYGTDEVSLTAQRDKLEDLDALIVDLQDVGARYYTYLTTIYNLFNLLKREEIELSLYILDRENPAGRSVEGTLLRREYTSFIGIEGIVHRHGLTIGEMANLFYSEIGAKFPLHIISYTASSLHQLMLPWSIPPSPNFPGLFTSHFYSGQCLWEGTNVSEGRGTTRPFEIFGAPFMEVLMDYNRRKGYENWNDPRNPIADPAVFVRWTKFIPTFHKYKGESCFGFQLLPNPGQQYHALTHSLKMIRFVAENCEDFCFPEGKYEAGNDRSAIELLVGDPLLLQYIRGESDWGQIREHIKIEEQKWIRKAKRYQLYEDPLYRIK